jgi:Ser/Thr protein kinase RdoA (MazF antagonist)
MPPAPQTASDPDTRPRTPYADLGPDVVLDALAAVGLRGDGRLIQLNSYENRVFQAFLEDGRAVVAKFYRPGRWTDAQILEEHAYAAELAADEIPVAAPWSLTIDAESTHARRATLLGPTLAAYARDRGIYRYAVSARFAGRAPELEESATLEWIGRFVGRIHAVGARRRFEVRQSLDLATFGTANRDWLLSQQLIPPDAERDWRSVTAQALDAVGAAYARAGSPRLLRLHGDCHAGNILWTSEGPLFVDLDDTLTGPAIQDLWMLLSGDRATMTRQLSAVLAGYESFMDFDDRELLLVEALRTLRIIHHSAWIARRWDDPAFPIAFPWFESPSYWAQQTSQLREQIKAMAEPPLGSPA